MKSELDLSMDLTFRYPRMGGQQSTGMPSARERLMNPEGPALLRTPRRRGAGGGRAPGTRNIPSLHNLSMGVILAALTDPSPPPNLGAFFSYVWNVYSTRYNQPPKYMYMYMY